MKTAKGCKLFGAHQALMGIQDSVVLFHSVVGCNYGTMAFHLAPCNMTDVRQTCTVLSDEDIVFSGEASLEKALKYVAQFYVPQIIFVVTGCVSDIIQDDIRTVTASFEQNFGIRTIAVEAAGFRGDCLDGFETGLQALFGEIRKPEQKDGRGIPRINLIGLGADDIRLKEDIQAIRELLHGKAKLGVCFADCTIEQVQEAAQASLNLVFGRGIALAERMKAEFGIPYVCTEFPYGMSGAQKLWRILEESFLLDFSEERNEFQMKTAEKLQQVYTHLQALYGMPAAVIGTRARADGMAEFLSNEFGMEVEVLTYREEMRDLEDLYDRIRRSDTALICGSSYELELADELEIPLFRFDFPVFDRVSLSERPYVGEKGTLCLVEDLLNEIFAARRRKGALYQ